MIAFKITDTEVPLLFTLTENVSLNDPYYLFVFTHVLTGQKVKFLKENEADESNYQGRYNQFTINPSIIFEDMPTGEYHYIIYEQESSTNEEENLSGAALEWGKLRIHPAAEFTFTVYDQPTNFIAYNG